MELTHNNKTANLPPIFQPNTCLGAAYSAHRRAKNRINHDKGLLRRPLFCFHSAEASATLDMNKYKLNNYYNYIRRMLGIMKLKMADY